MNPPLDDRTWIVVPFDNLRQTQEIDWLRAASVNLLYLDMSRWRDVRVIDDERVADLMREVPEVRNPDKLDLNAGLAVARRAGARNLVMGDLLMLGNRTAVTAKVYDVRSGQRIRSVQEATTVQDSVMPLFGKLAKKILGVAPPEGVQLGTVGTNSIAAYQEYLRGVQALNGFNLAEARQHLLGALKLDSTFALAHYKLAIVGGWDNPNDTANRAHAEAAGRLAAGLPPRERGLIQGHLFHARRALGDACDTFSGLLRADSSDVEAWYGLGDCRYHDIVVEPTNGDTTRMRFRGNLNESIRAFRRALALDPTYHLAYQHIIDAYVAETRAGQYCVDNRCVTYVAAPIRSGESLTFRLVRLPRDTAAWAAQRLEFARTSRRRNLEEALATAEQWINTSPDENRARAAYAGALLFNGRVREADASFDRVRFDGTFSGLQVQTLRPEAKIKLWRPDAVRLYDSLRASPAAYTPPPGGRAPTLGGLIALLGPVFGRLVEYDSIILGQARLPAARRYGAIISRIMLGLQPDSAAAIERAAYDEQAAASGTGRATIGNAPTLAFALRLPRSTWPAIDTVFGPLYEPAAALARGDTARLRAAARKLDSLSASYLPLLIPDTGMTIVAADAFLILRDSLAALRMTRRMLDEMIPYTGLSPQTGRFPYGSLLPRAMLLRADLAAALGERDEARTWYTRFIDLWSSAMPELQPVVERARRSLAALGST